MAYTSQRGEVLTRRAASRVRQMPASDNALMTSKMRRRIDPRWKSPTNPPVFETLSSVVRATDVMVKKRKITVGGKLILSAAAADRLWRAVLNKLDDKAEAKLNSEFADRRRAATHEMNVVEDPADDSPFVVDMRNGYNFYHFLTEVLPQLALISRIDSSAPIFVHMPHISDMKAFVPTFVRQIYPQLFERIRFTDTKVRHDTARLVYNHRHYLYQSSDRAIGAALSDLPSDDPWHTLGSDRPSRKFLLKSTFDTGMRQLRADALDRLADLPQHDTPRRFWIGRDPENPNFKKRLNFGEAELIAELQRRDFHVLYMEKLSPLEQIAAINSAEMVVAPHGAAFAHMMFARRQALMLEIGTSQTQLHRWGDFLGNAHVAGCAYSTVFADVEGHGAVDAAPSIETGHHGIHIGDTATHRILDHVDEFLQRFALPAEAGHK